MMELKDRKFYEGVCEGETFEEGSAFYTRLLDTAEIIEEEGYDVTCICFISKLSGR